MNGVIALRQELNRIFDDRGRMQYGLEEVNQQAHALQTAMLAEAQGDTPAMVLAALLHDIGHLIHAHGENFAAEGRDDRHELLGAKWLSKRLPKSVTEPIRLHVAAKRFLCATDPTYHDQLSGDSVVSLALQGGPMSDAEVEAFRVEAFFADATRLRRMDEAAKDPAMQTPPLAHFLRHLESISLR